MYASRARDDETEPWQDFDPRRGEPTEAWQCHRRATADTDVV